MFQKIVFLFLVFLQNYAFSSHLSFSSAEHDLIGDAVVLKFSASDPGSPNVPLKLENGLNLTYGDVVSLGDFYGSLQFAISDYKKTKDRQALFLDIYKDFAVNAKAVVETPKIISLIREELALVESGMQSGEKEEAIYKKLQPIFLPKYNCATGGGCGKSTWWMLLGRHLGLMMNNFDHFGDDAITAYETGHQLAIHTAMEAYKTQDYLLLNKAYALNAFACHFLSDRFATGHMRTPRRELYQHVFPGIVGSVLAGHMHDEENLYGLAVHNKKGDQWRAYGDLSYLTPKSAQHRAQLIKAMQVSADEVYQSFLTGTEPTADAVLDLIPYPDAQMNATGTDIAPLFYWDAAKTSLMRRQKLSHPQDHHWTHEWWSWSTLSKLNKKKPLDDADQVSLAYSAYSEEAVRYGLITNPALLNAIAVHGLDSSRQSK